jgi:RNA polymerase sigma-70 factor (ECF subfamily)
MPELVYSQNRERLKLAEQSDRELLCLLKADDELALAELVARKTRALLQVTARIVRDEEEARDVVQVAFLKIWESRSKYDTRWSPNTWIYRIATNLAIDHWRSRRSRDQAGEPIRFHLLRAAESHPTGAIADLKEAEVERIFIELAAELTEKQRLIFLLRETEGLDSSEVAEIAGCEESTVRNHLFNARKILRQKLVERYPEYARAAGAAVPAGGPGAAPASREPDR